MRNPIIFRTCVKYCSLMAVTAGFIIMLTQCTDSFSSLSDLEAESTTSRELIHHLPNNASTLPSGALYHISLPAGDWSDLVLYAHGYVNPDLPLQIPDDDIDGIPISAIINDLGLAFATTSYSDNGLVIPIAVEDMKELLARFVELHGEPNRVYIVGPSEGGAVTTLAVEQYPELFDAGFATCGPIGDFRKQLNYIGDFHVLFRYFFPDIEVGSPEGVPDAVMAAWNNGSLKDEVTQAVLNRPGATEDLLKVAKVPADRSDPEAVVQAVLDLLRYNILGTNDAIEKLGNPYGNRGKLYFGTGSFFSDWKLNRSVERFEADPAALQIIENEYQSSGDLDRPLVAMHTTNDHEVPYWHELLYLKKVFSNGSILSHVNLPILGRYGHCNFKMEEVLAGFAIMVYKATQQNLLVPSSLLEGSGEQHLLDLSKEHGAKPVVVPGREFIQ